MGSMHDGQLSCNEILCLYLFQIYWNNLKNKERQRGPVPCRFSPSPMINMKLYDCETFCEVIPCSYSELILCLMLMLEAYFRGRGSSQNSYEGSLQWSHRISHIKSDDQATNQSVRTIDESANITSLQWHIDETLIFGSLQELELLSI